MINKDKAEKKDQQKQGGKPPRKMSEYGRQLSEKQKVKLMYGVRERQFRRFFEVAVQTPGAPGENLLSILERRLDNVTINPKMLEHKAFMENIIEKRLKLGIKIPDWLELDKKTYTGRMLRNPVRTDLQVPIEDYLIVE